MQRISRDEFIQLDHCIYANDEVLWVKHESGARFTASPLFSVTNAIENEDGINVCQSEYAGDEYYFILDAEEREYLVKLLSEVKPKK